MSCRSRLRVNGCSGSSDCAEFFRRNVTPTSCGPALTGTRVRSRRSSVSFVSAQVRVRQLVVFVAADRRQEHALAVDADLELVRPLEPRHVADDVLQEDDVEFVGRVEREVVPDEHAAARAERQAFDVIALRAIGRHAVDRADRRRRRVADRERADPCARPSRYCSSSDGDTFSTSAMLSNPFASSSAGRSAVASMSSASTSRIAAAYSDRFRRWSGERPGIRAC